MKLKLMMLVFLCIVASTSFGQKSIYKKIKKFAEDQGWTYATNEQMQLKEGKAYTTFFTLKAGRDYRIFAFGEYSDVIDVDCWLYDSKGNLVSKDIDDEGMAIVMAKVNNEVVAKVVVKNISSSSQHDDKACRILVTYREH